jgi:hypothetical protein
MPSIAAIAVDVFRLLFHFINAILVSAPQQRPGAAIPKIFFHQRK